jgi:hypothetical protein
MDNLVREIFKQFLGVVLGRPGKIRRQSLPGSFSDHQTRQPVLNERHHELEFSYTMACCDAHGQDTSLG